MAIYLDDRAMIAASKTYSKVITEVKAAWFEAQIRTCRIPASGSYLEYLTAKRAFGHG